MDTRSHQRCPGPMALKPPAMGRLRNLPSTTTTTTTRGPPASRLWRKRAPCQPISPASRHWGWVALLWLAWWMTQLPQPAASQTTRVKGSRVGNGEVFRFKALQCDKAKTLARYAGREFCDVEKIRVQQGYQAGGDAGEYSVIQYDARKRFKAVRCQRKVSTITAICGAFSHSKLVEPPDVLKPEKVTQQWCRDAATSGLITTEDGRQLKVGLGAAATYKFIALGEVTLSHDNAACEGGEMRVRGQKYDSLIRLVTVQLTLTMVDVVDDGGVLTVGGEHLPRACATSREGCELDDMTLVIDLSKVRGCPYTQIRRATFSSFTLEGHPMLKNDGHKLLFQVGDKEDWPSSCSTPGSLIKTNFDRIFLSRLPGTNDVSSRVDPLWVDIELEMRIADFYMEYWALHLVQESEASWQSEVCALSASQLNHDHVVIHGDHLLRMKGELVIEFKCEWTIVTAREGFKAEGERCLDHMPVLTEAGDLRYLAPLTRVLEPRSSVTALNCSTTFPVTVQDERGRMISANPGVGLVDVALSEYHNHGDDGGHNHSELFEVRSLLYTQEEIHDYEQLMLGPGSERAVAKQFSSYYCQASGVCNPSRDPQEFKWTRLLADPEELIFSWWRSMWEWFLWWGSVWGCFECVFTMAGFLWRLVAVCAGTGRTDLDRGTVFRFVFAPGQSLLNLFPRKGAEGPRLRMSDLDRREATDLEMRRLRPPSPAMRRLRPPSPSMASSSSRQGSDAGTVTTEVVQMTPDYLKGFSID